MFAMAPFMGSRNANRALGMGRRALFDDEETAGMANSLARGTGGIEGMGAVLRAQRGFGAGSELTEMLGAQTQRGGKAHSRSAMRELSQTLGVAVATGLERGRIGEVLRGTTQMLSARGLGISQNNTGVYQALGHLGGRFQGAEGVQAIQGMERAASAPTTALGRNIALRTAGLGGALGGDVFAAERRMELGFFGQGRNGQRGSGPEGLNNMLGMYRSAYGFGEGQHVGQAMTGEAEMRRGALIKEMSQNMGLSQTGAEAVIDAQERGASQKEVADLMKQGKPLQDRAYEAMIGMGSFKSLEKAFQDSFRQLWGALAPLILKLMKLVEEMLRVITPEAVSAIKNIDESVKMFSSPGAFSKMAKAAPGAVSGMWDEAGKTAKEGAFLENIAKSPEQVAAVHKALLGRAGGNSDDEKQAAGLVDQLVNLRKQDPKRFDAGTAGSEITSQMSRDQIHQIVGILKAVVKPPVVNVKVGPSLKMDASSIRSSHQDNSGVMATGTSP